MDGVIVTGNLETALHQLKKAIDRDGIFKAIKRRFDYPNLTERKRAKAGMANKRRLKRERLTIEREEG